MDDDIVRISEFSMFLKIREAAVQSGVRDKTMTGVTMKPLITYCATQPIHLLMALNAILVQKNLSS